MAQVQVDYAEQVLALCIDLSVFAYGKPKFY